jgi:MoaA/NifB/PqqE/SkfB family radical SAM enzyme
MIPEKFCIVPWIHLNPEPSGAIKPCCAYFDNSVPTFRNLKHFTLEEVWNNDDQKNLRKQFLNNQTPKGCDTCTKKEGSGNHSFRMAMNERFEKHIEPAIANTHADGQYDKFELIYWDFRFSNVCNFKCRMCGHGCSSSWYEESDKSRPKIMDKDFYGKDLMPYVDQFINVVEEVYFAGGEPLMMPEHYQVLDKLIEHERFDVFLRYNTNLSTIKYKSYDLINVWKKFKKVQLFLSLDGFGENAEYSRSGTDWPRVESNLEKIVEHDIPFVISCTINIFNVFHLPDFIDKLLSMNITLKRLLISNLTFPKYYEIALLSPELKIQLKEKYDRHLDTLDEENKTIVASKYNQIYYYLDMPISDNDEIAFVKTTLKLDASRNESITDTIPEYQDWFTNLKTRYNL